MEAEPHHDPSPISGAAPSLGLLRQRLAALVRRRSLAAWGAGLSAWLLAVGWILLAVFFLDWSLALDRLQRLLLLAVAVGGAAWTFRAWVLPLFGRHESEIDAALMVEKQQGIDSDLVAALQFEADPARDWGSPELRKAVVKYVAASAQEIDVFAGFSYGPFPRRAAFLAATALGVVALVLLAPGYLETFFARLALGSDHYPTGTQITQIVVNGRTIPLLRHRPDAKDAVVRLPYGLPLSIQASASGVLPLIGTARLRSTTTSQETTLDLSPGAPAADAAGKPVGQFGGSLPRFLESLTLRVEMGDAWTDSLTLEVLPPPEVDVKLTPHVPTYALKATSPDDAPPGARSIAVVEGSSVDLQTTSSKPLESATLTIEEAVFALEPADASKKVWKLSAPSPLAKVLTPLRYELQVRDTDGLGLEQPLQGFIRLKADRPPRCTAAMITLFVMPTAKPKISYGAADDFGIASLRLVQEVVRSTENSSNSGSEAVNRLQGEGETSQAASGETPAVAQGSAAEPDKEKGSEGTTSGEGSAPASAAAGTVDDGAPPAVPPVPAKPVDPDRVVIELPLPAGGPPPVVQGEWAVDLASLKLRKGDQVRLTLEAVDFRGGGEGSEGVVVSSDPLLLQVTDERGVLAAMAEVDERSAKSLDAIIQRQLGIGGEGR